MNNDGHSALRNKFKLHGGASEHNDRNRALRVLQRKIKMSCLVVICKIRYLTANPYIREYAVRLKQLLHIGVYLPDSQHRALFPRGIHTFQKSDPSVAVAASKAVPAALSLEKAGSANLASGKRRLIISFISELLITPPA